MNNLDFYMSVTPDQLEARARKMEARWRFFQDMAAKQNDTLKRHETWRQEYA